MTENIGMPVPFSALLLGHLAYKYHSELAGRLDSLLTLPGPARPSAAIRELGQVYLISQAYRRPSELPELLATNARHAVGWSITREALLGDSEALRVNAKWRVVAVMSEAQPDRLRRGETWMWRQSDSDRMPPCAVLIASYQSLPEPRRAATWLETRSMPR